MKLFVYLYIMKESIKNKLRNLLSEALITLGGVAYPKDNNVVIFAGGSGSGKGFIKDNLLGIEGIVFDTDALKEKYTRSEKLKQSLKDEFGFDADSFNFKNPDDVSKLHTILSSKGIPEKIYQTVLNSVAELERKPNIIFDVTLSNLTRLHNISFMLKEVGYKEVNTHLVWVLTEYSVAMENNKRRDRVVPKLVFKDIHKGVSRTMNDLLQMENIAEYVDGDIWIVFNNPLVDTNKTTSPNGGSYLDKVNYVKLKSKGQPLMPYETIERSIIDKINTYVHHKTKWSTGE